MPTEKIHQITLAGAVLFIIGLFLPLTSFPVIGDVTYYRVDNTSAIITLILAAAAPILIFLNKKKFTALPAIGVWIVLLWPAIKNIGSGSDDGGLLGDLVGKATDPLASFAKDLFLNINEFSWGGFVLLLGLLVLTVGSILTSLKAK